MPTKRTCRARHFRGGIEIPVAVLWALSDGRLGTAPPFEKQHGFMSDFCPALANRYHWWISLHRDSINANREAVEILWQEFGEEILRQWRAAGLRGLPSWSKKFNAED